MASARVQRWTLTLSGFNYEVEYVKGSVNEANNLSSIPQPVASEDRLKCNYINLIEKDYCFNLNFKGIARESRRDPNFSQSCGRRK